MKPIRILTTGVVAVALTAVACAPTSTKQSSTTAAVDKPKDPGKCIAVDMAVSSEKTALMTQLAADFNSSPQAKVGSSCVFVRPKKVASGAAAALLVAGWPNPDTNGPRPVVWSPAASSWAGVVNQRSGKTIAPPAQPFMLTPLVIAMPQKMAAALGYPGKPIGFKDIVDLANDPAGWAKFGHPEWGPFRLGKTNPNFSTSGLNFTIAEYYAATGKSRDLTVEDLARPEVAKLATGVESAVVHYGDTTLTFLNNWFAADARSSALTYTSAVAVEEKSVIDYNLGNPDGELAPGERPRVPREKLVAIYPSEGTLFSDNPFIVLDAEWVTAEQKQAALLFQQYIVTPENQAKVMDFGFRPGNPAVQPGGTKLNAANGIDLAQPQAVLDVPSPAVVVKVLDTWAQQRKTARVMIVMDVSGSMGEAASSGSNDTKLDLAKRAAISALDQFKEDDDVGLRIFSTGLNTDAAVTFLDLVPVGPIGAQREGLKRRIDGLNPVQGTPLYSVAAASYTEMVDKFDPAKINAVVLLTDGRNDDGNQRDDTAQLNGLIQELQVGAEGANSQPVRIFPIAYGKDADLATLRQIAEASHGAAYDASNPATIEQVFTAVVSNF